MASITHVTGREILDSRGNPTIEVDIRLSDGTLGRAAVPSGASTGSREAVELRDGDTVRYAGKGVTKAVANVITEIASVVIGHDPRDQAAIDRALIDLDGTPNKARLGANAILGVSMAVARAGAISANRPLYRWLADRQEYSLPVPTVNVINGGAHAANALDFQEFMLVPHGAQTLATAVRWCAETFHVLKRLLRDRGQVTSLGDEGGYAPNLTSPEQALDLLVHAIEMAGLRPGADVALSMDPAASAFHRHGHYVFEKSGLPAKTTAEMIDWFEGLMATFPIVFIEDGLAEDDWDGWATMTQRLGSRALLVGDDIFVTSPEVIRTAIARGIGNAALIKLNQIGTVTETLEAMDVAHQAGYRTIVSHRSGETEDTFIADLAVAAGAAYIKSGSMARSERVAKYNQLLRIEEELGTAALYGRAARMEVRRA
ncbi:MAG: phosphopyruvate hydratase [Vicinamibacterales bacterium]